MYRFGAAVTFLNSLSSVSLRWISGEVILHRTWSQMLDWTSFTLKGITIIRCLTTGLPYFEFKNWSIRTQVGAKHICYEVIILGNCNNKVRENFLILHELERTPLPVHGPSRIFYHLLQSDAARHHTRCQEELLVLEQTSSTRHRKSVRQFEVVLLLQLCVAVEIGWFIWK